MEGAMIRSRDPIWREGAGAPGKETRQKAVNFGEKTAALPPIPLGASVLFMVAWARRREELRGDAAELSKDRPRVRT